MTAPWNYLRKTAVEPDDADHERVVEIVDHHAPPERWLATFIGAGYRRAGMSRRPGTRASRRRLRPRIELSRASSSKEEPGVVRPSTPWQTFADGPDERPMRGRARLEAAVAWTLNRRDL
jgi:hypothetical protein